MAVPGPLASVNLTAFLHERQKDKLIDRICGCKIVETPDGMFPEKPRHWTIRYRVGDKWYPAAVRYNEEQAKTIYKSWSSCSHFEEVELLDSEAGLIACSYPKEGRFLGILGEERVTTS